jgi:hypothetical protein
MAAVDRPSLAEISAEPRRRAKQQPAAARRAERQKDYRRRKRDGQTVFRVCVADQVIEALLVSGRLSDDASRDRERVQIELAGVIEQWAARWLK